MGIQERVERDRDGLLFILKYQWSGFDAVDFAEALEVINRRDLSVKVKNIPCLHSSSPLGIEKRTKSVRSFVNMLREEMRIHEWRFIVQTRLGRDAGPKMQYEEIFYYCIDKRLFTPDLGNLCELMCGIRRSDLEKKIKEYQPSFKRVREKQFRRELKRELKDIMRIIRMRYI